MRPPRPAAELPPRVYHLAEPQNWQSIQSRGLLCAHELLKRCGLPRAAQLRWHHDHRPALTLLPDGTVIRDQNPMPPDALRRCLVGLTPAQWYMLLNRRVFFWLDPERMRRMRNTYISRPLLLLTLDTAKLLERAGPRAEVTPINTGFALRKAAKRGRATFVPLSAWRRAGWAREAAGLGVPLRSRAHAPAELLVRGGVEGVMECVAEVRELAAGEGA